MTARRAARAAQRTAAQAAGGLVTRTSLGAWLVKCNPGVTDVTALIRNGGRTIDSWCVAPNYRADLMAPGDPVVLWISGDERGTPAPGVWGVGGMTGPVEHGRRASAPMRVQLLPEPIRRSQLRDLREFAQLEVLRQPMGSNPSWLDTSQWQALRRLLAVPANHSSR